MWFWFFEARHNPETAPLVINLAGGPGGNIESSIFEHDGPCHIHDNETEPSLNPYSFNEYANMLYVDQPFAAGFSYGFNPINSTVMSSQYLWKFLQAFMTEFSSFKGRDFGIYTASYGGHFGSGLGHEILRRNDAIAAGSEDGISIELTAIGLQNACMDLAIEADAKIDYALYNGYATLINRTTWLGLKDLLANEIKPIIDKCQRNGTAKNCYAAAYAYTHGIESPLMLPMELWNVDPYNMKHAQSWLKSPDEYLWRPEVLEAIGARSELEDVGGTDKFTATGDMARSAIPDLSALLDADVNIGILTGDADFVCNCIGTANVAQQIPWIGQKGFNSQVISSYDLDGEQRGIFRAFDTLGVVEVTGGGHAFGRQYPELLLQLFKQTMEGDWTST